MMNPPAGSNRRLTTTAGKNRRANKTGTRGNSSTSTGSTLDSRNSVYNSSSNKRSQAVWAGRIVFVVFMMSFGAMLGYGSYRILRKTETDASEAEFISIAERALVQALQSARRDQAATATLSSVTARLLPNVSQWPFVYIPDFDVISQNFLHLVSPGTHVVFLPLVLPEQAAAFEEFAYKYYHEIHEPPLSVGQTASGEFGIWREVVPEDIKGDYNVTVDQTRIHATTGETNWGSPYRYMTPILHWTNVPFGLMFDTHSTETQGGLQTDGIINCTREHMNNFTASPADPEGVLKCSALTDVFALWANQKGPESAIFSPIYLEDNTENSGSSATNRKLVGFTALLIIWKDVFENLFSDTVVGIDVILETDEQIFTYEVVDGEVLYKGRGDLHNNKSEYNKLRRTVQFVEHGLFTQNSPQYSLTLYPNEEFYEIYSTRNPWIAAFGSAAIFIVTCLLFGLYDYIVGKEVRAKQDLLKAKRNFMRFVSHEVRTPLNSVCMGLELVQREIAEAFGCSSIEALKKKHRPSYGDSAVNAAKAATTENCSLDAPTSTSPPQEPRPQQLARRRSSRRNVEEGKKEEDIASKNKKIISEDEALEWFDLTSEIMDHAQSAVAVLSDILNYDKIEAGTLSLEIEPLLIFPLILTTVDEFRLPAEDKGIRYESELIAQNNHPSNPDLLPQLRYYTLDQLPPTMRKQCVIGDWVRLQQVLRNFLSNAIKFSKSSDQVHVEAIFENDYSEDEVNTLETRECTLKNGHVVKLSPSGRIVINIRDTGAGMTSEQLSKLFTAGVQFNVNELQGGKGSGLGLFIAKGIVEQHGSTVVARSDGLGKGTTFSLTLPAFAPLIGDEERCVLFGGMGENSDLEATNVSTGADLPTRRTVLVVDDVFANRRLLSRLLEKSGDICEQAVDGLDCLDKVNAATKEGRQYDIVLLDYEMPNLNGPDCARKLRSLGCASLIVGVSGNCLPEDVEHFKSQGADAVLPKPFKLASLQEIWIRHGIKES